MDPRLAHAGVVTLMGLLVLVGGGSDNRLVLGTAGLLAGVAGVGLVAWSWRGWRWLPAGLLALHVVVGGLSMLVVDGCGIGLLPSIIQYAWLNYLSATRVLVPLVLGLAAALVHPRDRWAGTWGVVLTLLFYAFQVEGQRALFCGLPE